MSPPRPGGRRCRMRQTPFRARPRAVRCLILRRTMQTACRARACWPLGMHMANVLCPTHDSSVLRDRCVAAMEYSARSDCLVALHSLFSRRPASSGSISAYDCRDGGRLLFSRTAFMCATPCTVASEAHGLAH